MCLVAHSPSVERLLRPFSTTCHWHSLKPASVNQFVTITTVCHLHVSSSRRPMRRDTLVLCHHVIVITTQLPHPCPSSRRPIWCVILHNCCRSLSFVTTSLCPLCPSRHSYHIHVPHHHVPREHVWVCHDILPNKMVAMDISAHLGGSASTRS